MMTPQTRYKTACMHRPWAGLLVLLMLPGAFAAALAAPPDEPWFPRAAALPAPEGPVLRVHTAELLLQAIADAQPGTTILVADGHYRLPRYAEITADRVTLRGESGDRHAVVLDGVSSRHNELLGIRNASGVTIADLTVQNVTANAIKINNDTPVHEVTIRNCVIHNVWQRGVKSVRSPQLKTQRGVIEYCLFYNDRPKRFEDDPHDTADNFDGNYVGAIDLMDAVGWKIRDNVFVGIQGRTRVGRGAIFVWFESRDALIERNIIIDCDQGIALGSAHRPEGTPFHAAGFTVRNNFIARAPMNPIFLGFTRDTRVLHNSLHDPENPRRRAVRIFAANPGLHLTSNLIHGFDIRQEQSDNDVHLNHNLVDRSLTGIFRSPISGDLRLTAAAAADLPRVPRSFHAPADIDHNARPDPTLPGAADGSLH
jgi:hypothetical protein